MNSKPLETLHFKLGLSGTFWDKRPRFKICVGGKEVLNGEITQSNNDIEYFEFDVALEEDQTHTLEISLVNKTDLDCFVDEQGNITKDMLLNIESIEIDDIDLGVLKWTLSEFTPEDTSIAPLKSCINLGWNGTYRLTFESPFYVWLLEHF